VPLTIPYDRSGVDPKVAMVIDQIVAALQTWAGAVEGVNAAERLNELTSGVASLPTVQLGTILPYAGTTAPTGYLLCDGAPVSRTTYANLFALVGTAFGVGDGSTTFNVPDLQRRFPMGKSSSDTVGGTGGSFSHTHTGGAVSGSTASEASHTHGGGSLSAAAGGDHDHGGTVDLPDTSTGMTAGGTAMPNMAHVHGIVGSGTHTHTIAGTSAAGSAHSHSAGTLAVGTSGSNNPPYVVINYIVKT